MMGRFLLIWVRTLQLGELLDGGDCNYMDRREIDVCVCKTVQAKQQVVTYM